MILASAPSIIAFIAWPPTGPIVTSYKQLFQIIIGDDLINPLHVKKVRLAVGEEVSKQERDEREDSVGGPQR